ncbi:MAG: flavodoxin family protein [Treponema sp.]|nr:flavodoxin family protein [Treponema sp.]
MGKKVLLINGSSRKKNTYSILVQIGQILKKYDIDSEILNMFDYKLDDCTGCDEICIKKDGCNISDDMPVIMKKIIESDGIVFGTPVYLGGVTSKLKTFIDRTNTWFHKPELAGKPVFSVITTATTGIKETCNFLDQYAVRLGARKAGYISRSVKTWNVPVEEKEMKRFLSLLNTGENYYKPGMNQIIIFQVQKVLALKSDGSDRKFWEERNWINKYYYYNCRINILKKAFSKMMFKILTNAMK